VLHYRREFLAQLSDKKFSLRHFI